MNWKDRIERAKKTGKFIFEDTGGRGMGISDYDFSDTDNMRAYVWCSNCVDIRPKEKVNKK